MGAPSPGGRRRGRISDASHKSVGLDRVIRLCTGQPDAKVGLPELDEIDSGPILRRRLRGDCVLDIAG